MENLPRIVRLGVPALVIALLGGFAVWKLFIEVESPDEVSTDSALEQLSEDLAGDDEGDEEDEDAPVDTTTTQAPVVIEGVFGTWTVDDEFGDFSFSTASGSFAGFRVEKTLFVGGGQTAVGRSGSVTGSVTIADGELAAAEIVVDTTEMVSDQAQRESAIHRVLKSGEFSTATFVVADAAPLDTDALDAGDTVIVEVTGELTIAGVTNTVTTPIEATVPEPGIGVIIGSAPLVWADYGVETPTSSAGTVADDGILEFQLVVRLG